MSERITWTKCPVCGAPMAVGWVTTAEADGEPVEEVPEELDCSAGCAVTIEELRRSWDERPMTGDGREPEGGCR